ncbi:MAG: hypothetical protein WAL45_15955, partial [Terracidiphilus sp.]
AEHPILNSLISTHTHETGDTFAPMQNGTYFNKFLGLTIGAGYAQKYPFQGSRNLPGICRLIRGSA